MIYQNLADPGKNLRHSLIDSLIESSLSSHSYTAPPRHKGWSSSSFKVDYVIVVKNFVSIKGHQNCIVGSKVTVILLKDWILPIGGVALERVCACSLRRRSVFTYFPPKKKRKRSYFFFLNLAYVSTSFMFFFNFFLFSHITSV